MYVLHTVYNNSILHNFFINSLRLPLFKKHGSKVIEKNFDNKKYAHILYKYNNERIIGIHHWRPEIFHYMWPQKMIVFCNFPYKRY